MSKSDTAVASILALAIDDCEHAELASILQPLVAALPAQREWSEDDEWTPAECACEAARRFVELHATPDGRDPWMALHDVKDLLRGHQRRHREMSLVAALGDFPGYTMRARISFGHGEIQVWRDSDQIGVAAPFLSLPSDVNRREAELAIRSCAYGYSTGVSEGANAVRTAIRNTLCLE